MNQLGMRSTIRQRWLSAGVMITAITLGGSPALAFDDDFDFRDGRGGVGNSAQLEHLAQELEISIRHTLRLAEREASHRRGSFQERAIEDLEALGIEAETFRNAVEDSRRPGRPGRGRNDVNLDREFDYLEDAADRAERSVSIARFTISVDRSFAQIRGILKDIDYTLDSGRDVRNPRNPRRPMPRPVPAPILDFVQVDKMRPAKFGYTTETIRVRQDNVTAIRLASQEKLIQVSRVTVHYSDGQREELHSLVGSYREGDSMSVRTSSGFRGAHRDVTAITVTATTQSLDGGAGKLVVEVGIPRRR